MFRHLATMMAWLTSLAVVLCVCFVQDARGSAILFQSSTSSIKPLITSNLTLTCSLPDTTPVVPVVGRSLTSLHEGDALAEDVMTGQEEEIPEEKTAYDLGGSDDLADADGRSLSQTSLTQTTDNMAFITSIIISHDGEDIATVSGHYPATQLHGASGFQVSGQVPGTSGDKGHLELVWTHPTQADTGTYVCDVGALDAHGRMFVFSQSVEISAADVSINDLVGHLQKTELEKEAMQKTIADQANTIADQANTIRSMINSDDKLNQSLDALRAIARVEPNIFFSAAANSIKSVTQNQAVIYDIIYINEGASYSGSTGAFTCPVGGFYHFEIHVFSDDDDAWLNLRHNGNDVITALCVGDYSYKGSSNSVTLHLVKGDIVSVVSHSARSVIFGVDSTWRVTTFHGRLIALA